MTTFSYVPGTAELAEDTDILMASFGDGYAQRAGDGINIRRQVWNLTFSRALAEAQAIRDFLRNQGTASFDWTPPGESTSAKFFCKTWQYVPGEALRGAQVMATFTQVFGE